MYLSTPQYLTQHTTTLNSKKCFLLIAFLLPTTFAGEISFLPVSKGVRALILNDDDDHDGDILIRDGTLL